ELVTMEEQDRSLWDHGQIEEGLQLIGRAIRIPGIGPYQLQAAIAGVHGQAKSSADTDWPQVAMLYERLLELSPSPIVALNHAVAVAMAQGPEAGLKLVDEAGASGALDGYYLFHAARADLLRRLDRRDEAAEAYRRALAL